MNYQYVYDLDDKINLLYDCVYNFTTKNSFLVDNINLQNITISDIKFIIPDKKNTLEVSEYNDIKDKIFNAKFKLLNFDEINYSCLLKRFSNQFSILIKINFYKQKNEIDTMYNLFKMDYSEIQEFDTGSKFYINFPLQEKIQTYKPLLRELVDLVNQQEKAIFFILYIIV